MRFYFYCNLMPFKDLPQRPAKLGGELSGSPPVENLSYLPSESIFFKSLEIWCESDAAGAIPGRFLDFDNFGGNEVDFSDHTR